jgi:hypothetical protein
MDTYIILRRSGWRTPEELEEAARRPARRRSASMPRVPTCRRTRYPEAFAGFELPERLEAV